MDKIQEKVDVFSDREMQQRRTKDLVEKEARLDEVIMVLDGVLEQKATTGSGWLRESYILEIEQVMARKILEIAKGEK